MSTDDIVVCGLNIIAALACFAKLKLYS